MISVRNMTNQDYDEVREHLSKCWNESYAHLLQPSEFAKMLASLNGPTLGLIAPDSLGLVALDTIENRVLGTAFAVERCGVCYIWGVYVATHKKRFGVGRTLINGVSAHLSSANELSVTVLKASSGANAFYRSQGFVPVRDCDYEFVPGKIQRATILVKDRSHS